MTTTDEVLKPSVVDKPLFTPFRESRSRPTDRPTPDTDDDDDGDGNGDNDDAGFSSGRAPVVHSADRPRAGEN